jgi:2-polyprenyl-3-methyl-5-hydroxy-6-metoxy-1,4-benzoquinol methylase
MTFSRPAFVLAGLLAIHWHSKGANVSASDISSAMVVRDDYNAPSYWLPFIFKFEMAMDLGSASGDTTLLPALMS